MKVKELIEKLKEFDENEDVIIYDNASGDYDIFKVELTEWKDKQGNIKKYVEIS